MRGFGKIVEAMMRMKQMRQQPNPSTSSVEPDNKFRQIVNKGRMLGGGGFGNIVNKTMQMRQMQGKPNMTTSGPNPMPGAMKKGGAVKSSASKRADGCAQRGKTRA
jgi:hypothetical protein